MPLSQGTRLGPYEIITLIGVGGMGEVYRARDTRLDRIVAIKMLPQTAAVDPRLRLRVEQEARTVAAISHPHICALYDVGREGEIDYFVMEFLEGETLADRIARGPLPLDLVIRYGTQIAGALAAAHRHGAVHRDLKPANIMLTREGAKLLDFGIATLREGDSALAPLLDDESITLEGRTIPRTLVGTLHYMAPEQLQGRPVDSRSDVFALGVVLYHMIAGRLPFEGDTPASVIAAIISATPPPLHSLLLRPVPAALEHVMRTCLAKDPEDRWQSAQDIQRELTEIAGARVPVGPLRARTPRTRWFRRLGAVAALAALLGAIWVWQSGFAPTEIAPIRRVRFDVQPVPPAMLPAGEIEARVSPDGQHLAFVAHHAGVSSLWVRSFDAAAAQEVAGTNGASQPFWSPDSRTIGFYAEGALKRVALDGGAVQTLCSLRTMAGATWSPRGVIVFSQLNVLGRIPDNGGSPVLLPPLAPPHADAIPIWPQFLPDGEHYLFRVVRGPRARQGLFVGSLDSPTITRVLDTTVNVAAAGSYLLFVRSGSLMAQPFDVSRVRASGEPVAIAEQVMENLGELAGPSVSVSDTGVLAYRARHAFPTTITWFDRKGVARQTLNAPVGCRNPEISPDGRRVAVECPDVGANARDIWVLDAVFGAPARLTADPADESDPIWSPDGRWIVFSSARDGGHDLYRRPSTGAGRDEPLLRTGRTKYPGSWSRDGRFILFTSREENTGWDVWLRSPDGQPVPVISTPAVEIEPQLSPNARWLAYTSDESGRMDIYIRPFRAPGGPWRISTGGGTDPRWRDDGSELYYLSPDRALMVVGVTGAARPDVSVPKLLFETPTSGPLGVGVRFNYAVAAGGQRFLITADVPETKPSPINVIMNWRVGAQGSAHPSR